VQVDDAPWEAPEEAHREDAHPTGEHDEIGAGGLDGVGEANVVGGPRFAAVAGEVGRGDAGGGGPLEGEGIASIRDDMDDGSVDEPGSAGVDDRLQVAAGAGCEDGNSALPHSRAFHPSKLGAGAPAGQRP
jgi:hypothetical protein